MDETVSLLSDEHESYMGEHISTWKSSVREPMPNYRVNRKAKDSVFTDLFKDKKYLMQLYRTLHPEDDSVTEDELTNITLLSPFMNGNCNDLGFLVGDRYMILVEAQSTWSVNIAARGQIYAAQTYDYYIRETKQNRYSEKKLRLPKPELYVIYTGEKGNRPDVLTLSGEFFGGAETGIETRMKVIYRSESDNIINQYIDFTRVFDEQVRLYGREKKAIEETMRICCEKGILKEYLEKRESEVMTMIADFFDEEKMIEEYITCEREEARREGRQEGMEKGRQEGEKRGKREALIESVRSIMGTLKYTAVQAMNLLKIPEEEQAEYIRLINKD